MVLDNSENKSSLGRPTVLAKIKLRYFEFDNQLKKNEYVVMIMTLFLRNLSIVSS